MDKRLFSIFEKYYKMIPLNKDILLKKKTLGCRVSEKLFPFKNYLTLKTVYGNRPERVSH